MPILDFVIRATLDDSARLGVGLALVAGALIASAVAYAFTFRDAS